MIIIGLIVLAVVLVITSAINAVAIYGAAYLANAEYNDYFQSLVIILKGYAVFFLAAVCVGVLHINSIFLAWVIIIGVPCWTVYTLINVLSIRGTGNVILFVCMSLAFNVILFYLLSLLRA